LWGRGRGRNRCFHGWLQHTVGGFFLQLGQLFRELHVVF
jgi:hypothetical protein